MGAFRLQASARPEGNLDRGHHRSRRPQGRGGNGGDALRRITRRFPAAFLAATIWIFPAGLLESRQRLRERAEIFPAPERRLGATLRRSGVQLSVVPAGFNGESLGLSVCPERSNADAGLAGRRRGRKGKTGRLAWRGRAGASRSR